MDPGVAGSNPVFHPFYYQDARINPHLKDKQASYERLFSFVAAKKPTVNYLLCLQRSTVPSPSRTIVAGSGMNVKLSIAKCVPLPSRPALVPP